MIFESTKNFYTNLFKDRTCFAKCPHIEKDIETLLQNNKKNVFNSVNLGQDVKVYEINQALKSIKIIKFQELIVF